MEDRHFYVACNWTSEENDLLKVMLMTTKQCQSMCREKKKMEEEHIVLSLSLWGKRFCARGKIFCDHKNVIVVNCLSGLVLVFIGISSLVWAKYIMLHEMHSWLILLCYYRWYLKLPIFNYDNIHLAVLLDWR